MEAYSLQEYPTLAAFLDQQEAATIAVPIDNKGGIHAASLLYVHTTDPLAFYFVTAKDTLKYTLLKTRDTIPCAVVIGTVKDVDFTLQMHGTLSQATPNARIVDDYYKKRGNRHDDINSPKNVCLVFKSNWARFTDYSKDYARFMLEV